MNKFKVTFKGNDNVQETTVQALRGMSEASWIEVQSIEPIVSEERTHYEFIKKRIRYLEMELEATLASSAYLHSNFDLDSFHKDKKSRINELKNFLIDMMPEDPILDGPILELNGREKHYFFNDTMAVKCQMVVTGDSIHIKEHGEHGPGISRQVAAKIWPIFKTFEEEGEQ